MILALLLACAGGAPKDTDGPPDSGHSGAETAADSADTGGPDDTGPLDDTGHSGDTSDTSDTSHTGETGDTDCFATTWYSDLDGDEYGGVDSAQYACEPTIPNPVLTGGDCDDTNPDVHPEVEEVCGDGIDNNCDGEACGPFREVQAAETDVRIQGPTTDSLFGTSMAVLPADDGLGLPLLAVGAPGPGSTGLEVTDTWVFPSLVSGDAEDLASRITGTSYADDFGGAVASAGDVDGDGVGDLWVAAPNDSTEGPGNFGLYLFTSPLTDQDYTDARVTLHGGIGEYGGNHLSRGDADGDGVPDLIVGSGNAGGSRRGQVLVVPGTGLASGSVADVAWTVLGAAAQDTLDTNAAGDVDGDGVDDLLLGAVGADGGAGRAFLLRGPTDSDRSAAEADLVFTGEKGANASGRVVAVLHDLDGDGLRELGVGTPDRPYGIGDGRFSVHPGLDAGTLALDETWLVIEGTGPAGYFGSSVASGDFDGDGGADLAVGSPYLENSAFDRGKVSVFRAPAGGTLTEDDAIGSLWGENEGWLGTALESADFDGDGCDELVTTAPEAEGTGVVYVLWGGSL